MDLLLPLRSLLVTILRVVKRTTAKTLASLSGLSTTEISGIERGRVKQVPDSDVEALLAGLGCSKTQAIVVISCIEALQAHDPTLDPEAAAAHERFIASVSRQLRRRFRSSAPPPPCPYPGPHVVEIDRFEAGEDWELFRGNQTPRHMTLVLRNALRLQRWAFVERLCDESVRAASKDPRRALALAIVAVRAARLVGGWELWRLRLAGFALAHLANALRVACRLDAADRILATARRFWDSGLDPDQILDPGRLFDLEASLRRAQRRFPEALDLLEKAAPLTRRREHVALKLASVLSVMGEDHRAIAVLTELGPLVEAHPELRLKSIQRFNLAVALSMTGRPSRAAQLLPGLRKLVREDEMDRIRFRWLEGRIFAGLGRTEAALAALDEARSGFIHHRLGYDVALSLLDTAALLLERGEWNEVERLTAELAPFFAKAGIHEEALKALRLFEEAAARRAATAELARRLLAWLFRARHDPGLVFTPPAG